MADDFDPWAGSTGLPVKLDIDIKDAWFEFDPEYDNGQTLRFILDVMTDDEDFGEAGRGTLKYSCGKGWQAGDGGKVAEREDGANKGFHVSTGYYRFVSGAISAAEKYLRSKGDPRDARVWIGTKWHLDAQEVDFGGEIGKRSSLIPTSFIGDNASGAKSSGPVSKAAGPVTKAAPATAPAKAAGPVAKAGPVKKAAAPIAAAPAVVDELPADDGESGLPEQGSEAWGTLYDLAMECDTLEQFAERAHETIDGVADNPAISQFVMSGESGSVWAAAVEDYQAGTVGAQR